VELFIYLRRSSRETFIFVLLENLPFVPLGQHKPEVFFSMKERRFIAADTLELKYFLSAG
jgi:hypothetical protein